jgi:dTMP kinase
LKKGSFIVFEGIDGSGKTTQVKLLEAFLVKSGRRVLTTRDPGSTALGEQLREVLLFSRHAIDPVAEALMYAAARAQYVSESIMPALREGRVVVSDRFAASLFAYQGWGKGVDLALLDMVNRHSCRDLAPDMTILLDIDPSAALSRLKRPADRMEGEGREFLQRVRRGYLSMADGSPHRFRVIDAGLPEEDIFAMVKTVVEEILQEEIPVSRYI